MQFAQQQCRAAHVGLGSFSTESAGIRLRSMSASLRKRPKCCVAAKLRYVPILLQKSKTAQCYFSRDNTIRSKIADVCSLNLVREVTREFIVRR
jgi:hypothetical protein